MASPFAGDVKLPVIGSVPKVAVVVGVGGVIVLIVIHNRQAKSSTAAASTGTPAPGGDPYPPDGTQGNPQDLYSTDPATGVTYGDELVGYAPGFGYGTGVPPTDTTGTGSGGTTGTGGPPFSSNDQWAQYAQSYLTGTVGLDPGTVSQALGLYITGQPVTAAQETVIQEALAFAGSPPVPGPNGMPPSINVTGNKTGGGDVTVPNVVGLRRQDAEPKLKAANLGWNYTNPPPTGNRDEWVISAQTPKNGARVASGATIHLTIKDVSHGRKPPGPPVKKG